MLRQKTEVVRIPTKGPGDVSGLRALLDCGRLDARDIVAVIGKTEGNGGVNDFTREFATRSVAGFLASRLAMSVDMVDARIAFVMSGGTEGVLSPHLTVFSRRRVEADAHRGKGLAIGVATTRPFLPEELGRRAQIVETAKAMRLAMDDAGIENPQDVHFVQIKCPLLTAAQVEAAMARGCPPVTQSAYGSMAYSRGASALGVAVGLGEIPTPPPDDAVLKDWSLYSTVASTSAGIELNHNVIVLMGNSEKAASDFVIGHAVMQDAIDLPAIQAAFASAGSLAECGRSDLVNVFAKAEASPSGKVRGERHTMLDDSDINATRHARAAVGGLVAGVAGSGSVYVSGGAEHQGPAGGGPVAVIFQRN